MKPIRFYEEREGLGFVEVTAETARDFCGSLYVECLSCPVLVPARPNGLAHRRFIDGRPLCQDCTAEVEEAEYLAMWEQRDRASYDRDFSEYRRDGRYE